MSIFNYLQLQPVEPSDDGTVSDLDTFQQDETIDLNEDINEKALEDAWDQLIHEIDDDPDKLTFSEK